MKSPGKGILFLLGLVALVLTIGLLREAPPKGRPLDVGPINADLVAGRAGGEAWVRDPKAIGLRFAGPREGKRDVQTMAVPFRGNLLRVVVFDADLGDDSVQAERRDLRLRAEDDGSWTVEWATHSWRCHEGRGHRNWSDEPCS